MTFLDLVQRTIDILDVVDRDDEEMVKAVKNAINVAYMTIARDKYRPEKCETVRVVDGKIAIDKLSECYVSLKTVQSVGGMRIAAWESVNNIHISPSYYQVNVFYYYLPKALEGDFDVPVIPESAVDPYAYIYYAASYYFSVKRKHAEAAVWDSRYKNVADNIKEVRSSFTLPIKRWQ